MMSVLVTTTISPAAYRLTGLALRCEFPSFSLWADSSRLNLHGGAKSSRV